MGWSPAPNRFLVTIDRDCRSILVVDAVGGTCEPIAEVQQGLDPVIERALNEDARKWNRGLKTIRPLGSGWVVCDIFGVYRLSGDFSIERYLSIPEFMDIHSAVPVGDALLVSNTGVDQVLTVDWEGHISARLELQRWFPRTPWMVHDLAHLEKVGGGDLRLLPLDWARESCHANWAEPTPLGLMVSCFIQGEIHFFVEGRPIRRVPVSGKCHAPQYMSDSDTILYAASEEDRVVEVDLEGRELWSVGGLRFPKAARVIPGGGVIIADTGNRRVLGVDRPTGRILWECAVPGTPYDVQPWSGRME